MNLRRLTVTLALFGIACGGTSPTDPDPVPDPTPTSKGFVGAGTHHTCGFNANGETWCWGRNQYGELGSTSNQGPVSVQARITDLAEVDSGTQATCGRKADGTLWCWGRILGENESTLRSPPQHVSEFGSDVRSFAMAEDTVFVTQTDGSLWTYTHGVAKQLVASGAGQVSVYYGDSWCFVQSDGTLGCQGNNDSGTLGDGTTNGGATQVKVPAGTLFQQVSVGGNFACGLSTAGEVWCWGANEEAQTGTRQSTQNCSWSGGGDTPCNPTPRKINGLPAPAKAIVTGYSTTLALLNDGTVWGWGSNDDFELGGPTSETCPNIFGNDPCSSVPVKVPVENMVSLSAGSDHVCGCDKDGTAWCWGSSSSGKLGTTSLPNSSGDQPPVQVQNFRCW
jgi:alpha-tubulin suppressor-like RCC1 family protein